jgi:hypothetical protein
MHCYLNFDCAQMGLDESGKCVNEESCYRWTEPCELYEIVKLKGFPGAVYLWWQGNTYAWIDEIWGFRRLNNCDWLLHYAASLNTFAEWQDAYYKLSSRSSTPCIRVELWDEFERLRRQVDPEYARSVKTL